MNFDIKCALSISFSVKQEWIEKKFLMWSHDKREMPLDIRLNSRILEIKKVYFPIRNFCNINYSAGWKAISFWQHMESYIVYESKIVYVDDLGGEHSSATGARIVSNSGFEPQAVSKTVPVTKYKTVIDETKRTAGRVKGTSPSSYMDYNPSKSKEFKEWIGQIIKEHSKDLKKYKNVENCVILDLCGTDEEAFLSIKNRLYSEASDLGKEQIPGDSYRDFEISEFDYDYKVNVILLPLFQIKYSYHNLEYDYYVNGTNADDIFVEDYPVDDEFVTANSKVTNEIQKEENLENLYFILAVILFILSLILACLGIVFSLVTGIGVLIFGVLYKKKKGKAQLLHEQLETLNSNREEARHNFNQKYNIGSDEERKDEEKFCPESETKYEKGKENGGKNIKGKNPENVGRKAQSILTKKIYIGKVIKWIQYLFGVYFLIMGVGEIWMGVFVSTEIVDIVIGIIFTILGILLFVFARKRRDLIYSAKRYARYLYDKEIYTIAELSNTVGIESGTVLSDIEKLIKKGYLKNLNINYKEQKIVRMVNEKIYLGREKGKDEKEGNDNCSMYYS